MGLWILATVVALLMLAIVTVALLSSRTDEVVRPEVPSWSLPSPRDLADPHFPLAWQGYDPDHVDAWIEGVRRAQEELWAALGPRGIADLRAQLDAARVRRAPTEVPPTAVGDVPPTVMGEVPPTAVGEVPPTAVGDEDTGEMAAVPVRDEAGEESLFLPRTEEPPPTIIPKVRVEERDDDR